MSKYNRKGGSGKSGSLKDQFTYYKRQLFNRLIDEESFERAMGGGADITPSNLFKRLNYQNIFNEGITRKVGSKTIRVYGEKAIETQISSLRKRASKSAQSQQFIDNYIESLEKIGMPVKYIERIRNRLNRTSSDKLTFLIRKGILPQIAFLYSETMNYDELYQKIIDAIDNGVSVDTLKDIKRKKQQLKPLIRKEFNIMYRW